MKDFEGFLKDFEGFFEGFVLRIFIVEIYSGFRLWIFIVDFASDFAENYIRIESRLIFLECSYGNRSFLLCSPKSSCVFIFGTSIKATSHLNGL